MKLTFNQTNNSAVNDVMGLDMLSAHGDSVTDMAQIRGSRFTGGNSIDRMLEINNIRTYTESSYEQRRDYDNVVAQHGKRKIARHGSARYGAAKLPFTSEDLERNYPGFNEEEIKFIEPEEANEKYGIDGQLKFDEPVSNLEAYLLKQRKEEEIKFNYVLDKAYGSQFWKGMGIEMGMALLDPVTLPLMFIPPLGGAKVLSALGIQGAKSFAGRSAGRLVTGGMAGFYGSVAVEPLIYSAAQQEQAQYGAVQSFFNIAFGTLAGGGLHMKFGALADGVRHIKARRHLAAFDTAVKQSAEGKNVEVTSIAHGSDEPTFTTPKNNIEGNSGKPGDQPNQPRQNVTKGDSTQPHQPGTTKEYAPHKNGDESLALIRQGEKGIKLSSVKLKRAMATKEYEEAVATAKAKSLEQKLAFRIKTKNGDFVVVRQKQGESLRLFDSDSMAGAPGETAVIGEKMHRSLLMHGVDMAAADLNYTGSVKLQDGTIHHVMSIEGVDFNPKMNQNNVVVAPGYEVAKMFQGDPAISLFSSNIKGGKNAILDEYSKFDEGDFLNDVEGQKPYFDEQILNDNLQQTGTQAGTQKGGFYKDMATGDEFYVKYPENVELAKNEFIAATLYREFGVPFPLTRLVGDAQGNIVGVASKIIPGAKMITPDDFVKLPAGVREQFAGHALVDMYLGNWDVVGNAPNFNMMQMPDGTLLRIDPGGALLFRAQGQPKKLSDAIDEMTTFLDKNKNPNAAKVFGSIDPATLQKLHQQSAARIFSVSTSEIANVIDVVGMPAKYKKELMTALGNRRTALAEKFARVEQTTTTKKGFIASNSFAAAQKALDKMAEQGDVKLTAAQKAIIKDYTQSSYGWINSYLRGQANDAAILQYSKYVPTEQKTKAGYTDAAGSVAQAKQAIDAHLKDLSDAINKTKLTKQMRVYRGGVPKDVFNGIKGLSLVDGSDIHTANAMIGGEVQLDGFTSTSLYRNKAFNFGSYPTETRVRINLPKGMPVLYAGKGKHFSFGTAESEIILPHGLTYVVKKATKSPQKGVIIELDALPPGEKLVKKINATEQIKIAEKYKVQPSNAVNDVDMADPDLQLGDQQNIKAELTPNKPKEQAAADGELEEIAELIKAEFANADPKYIKSLTKEIEDFNAKADQDIADAKDLYEATKAAAVCVRGAS